MCLGPRGKGLRVRNRAARELKLQPFLSRGVRKVRCSQGGGGGYCSAPEQGINREPGTCVVEAGSARTRCWGYEGGVGA